MAATLHLLRHAKSSWDDPALADRDRPLAPRGDRAGKLMARHLRERGIQPQLILCSPAVRARQTLELVAEAFERAPVEFDESIYGAEAGELLERLRRVPAGTESMLMVGHNPGFRDLILLLAGEDPDVEERIGKFPTAALASLAVAPWGELGPATGRLTDLVKPKELAS